MCAYKYIINVLCSFSRADDKNNYFFLYVSQPYRDAAFRFEFRTKERENKKIYAFIHSIK